MFSLTSKKKISLNYPQYPLLSGALEYNTLAYFAMKTYVVAPH